mgnify:CR=1 FL=1
MHASTRLRAMIERGELVCAPGAPDSLTARLVAQAGFPAVYMTGFGATASRLGTPDIGLLTQTEMTEHARNMVRATDLPVIADADTGYGGPSNIHRTVREYQQAGVAAIHLEDQIAPKRCGQMAGVQLMPAAEAASRIALACKVRDEAPPDQRLLIIARTDALAAAGVDEALARARRYAAAGADLMFVDGVKTVAEVEAIAAGLSGPKVVSLVDGTEASRLHRDELQAMGFAVVLYAVTALFAVTHAAQQALAALQAAGGPVAAPPISYGEFCALVDLPMHQALDDTYGAKNGSAG